jgi:small-conductance mechanosensitive channel
MEHTMQDILTNPAAVKALKSLALALVLLALAKGARVFAARRGKPAAETPHAIQYATAILLCLGMVFIWFEGVGPVLTALTIVAAALTIVAKEVILNFLGSFVIFWRELFAIGDRIQVGENSGDVIAKGILFFTLVETGKGGTTGHSTGRMVKVPNASVLTQPVINATRGSGYLWNELSLTVTTGSDWKEARRILLDGAEAYRVAQSMDLDRIRRNFERRAVFFRELTPRVYVSVASGGIRLTLRYLCRSRMVHDSEDFITTRFLDRLARGSLELASFQPE